MFAFCLGGAGRQRVQCGDAGRFQPRWLGDGLQTRIDLEGERLVLEVEKMPTGVYALETVIGASEGGVVGSPAAV